MRAAGRRSGNWKDVTAQTNPPYRTQGVAMTSIAGEILLDTIHSKGGSVSSARTIGRRGIGPSDGVSPWGGTDQCAAQKAENGSSTAGLRGVAFGDKRKFRPVAMPDSIGGCGTIGARARAEQTERRLRMRRVCIGG